MKYDFSGRVATEGVRCTDGTVFLKGSLAHNDGKVVSLVWNHNHDDPSQIIGKALLKRSKDGKGIDAYGVFNDTENGKIVKDLVAHGDVERLSVWANHLNRDPRDSNQLHNGDIKEVSFVFGSADPTAVVQQSFIQHSDVDADGNESISADIWSSEPINNNPGEIDEVQHADDEEEKKDMAAEEEKGQKTRRQVFDSMTDEQKELVYELIDEATNGDYDDDEDEDEAEHSDKKPEDEEDDEDFDDSDEEEEDETDDESDEDEDEEDKKHVKHSDGGSDMKHNVFEGAANEDKDYISHSDQQEILDLAKKPNMTFRGALSQYLDEYGIEHADDADAVAGFDDEKQVFDNRTSLNLMFPDYREAYGNMPELITSDQGWITTVLAKVKKAPFSRVRTSQVDIRNIDELRAKGYQKGKKKALSGNYALIRRTTDPQTVYVRSSLNRDDIVDITDFDYVQYQYNIDKLMLNEEVATAIMIGDSREDDAPDKIFPSHIRPILTDDELYVKHVTVDIDKARQEIQGSDTSKHFSDNYVYAEAIIEALLHAREQDFRGTGTPDFYCTPALMNKMLLSRDLNGRRIYNGKAELQSALNIGQIITAEQFQGVTRTDAQGKKHKLLGIVGNLADYQVGSTKGGEITHFNQFDIDFNQEKSLIETRLSGAVTRIYSFIVLEEDDTDTAASSGAKKNNFSSVAD